MKFLFLFLFSAVLILQGRSQPAIVNTTKPDPTKKILIADAACGECQFHLEGKSCDLAVRIDGHAYFVDGTGIDDYGNAHAKAGFCKAIRKAEVQGTIVNNRFKVTYFKLIPPRK